MTQDDFVEWLLARGFAEERSGYGHATAEEIAERLWADGFSIHDEINWDRGN